MHNLHVRPNKELADYVFSDFKNFESVFAKLVDVISLSL